MEPTHTPYPLILLVKLVGTEIAMSVSTVGRLADGDFTVGMPT